MEELIKAKCEEYNITPDILTPHELDLLRKEIEEEQNGASFRDSVLDDPDIHLLANTR